MIFVGALFLCCVCVLLLLCLAADRKMIALCAVDIVANELRVRSCIESLCSLVAVYFAVLNA